MIIMIIKIIIMTIIIVIIIIIMIIVIIKMMIILILMTYLVGLGVKGAGVGKKVGLKVVVIGVYKKHIKGLCLGY
jgi:hypothetical protein